MTTQTKRLLVVTIAVTFLGCLIAGWTVTTGVAWARDLPNRIVVDGDAIAHSFGVAITESYHAVLRDGDSATQVQVINDQFMPMIDETPEAAAWISDEYRDDILAIVDSDDPAASSAASTILLTLETETDSQRPRNGG